MSVGELCARSLKIAQQLTKQLGLQWGDRVCVSADHHDDLVPLVLGMLVRGVVINALHTGFTMRKCGDRIASIRPLEYVANAYGHISSWVQAFHRSGPTEGGCLRSAECGIYSDGTARARPFGDHCHVCGWQKCRSTARCWRFGTRLADVASNGCVSYLYDFALEHIKKYCVHSVRHHKEIPAKSWHSLRAHRERPVCRRASP